MISEYETKLAGDLDAVQVEAEAQVEKALNAIYAAILHQLVKAVDERKAATTPPLPTWNET